MNDDFDLLFAIDGVDGNSGQSPSTIEFIPGGFFSDPANIAFLDPPNNQPLTPADIDPNEYDTNTAEGALLAQSNKGYGVSLTADWTINENLSAKTIIAYRESEYKGGLDDETAFQDFQSFPETGDAQQQSLELQLSGQSGQLDWVGGLYYFREDGNTFSGPNTFITHGDIFDINQKTESSAIYVHTGYQFTDRVKGSAGIRYTEDDKDADALFTNFPWFLPPPAGNFAQRVFRSDDWDEVTWDASITFALSDNLTMYFQESKGYQNGGYPARPFGGPDTFVSFDPWKTA